MAMTFLLQALILAFVLVCHARAQLAFDQVAYGVQVPENAPVGTTLVTVHASSANISGVITYALQNPMPTENFRVDAETGQLTVARPLDRETWSVRMLMVTATESGSNMLASATVDIAVMDVNDNAPVFPHSRVLLTASGDADVGTFLYTFSATDLDSGMNAQLTYSLSGDQTVLSTLHIDTYSGQLRVLRPLTHLSHSALTFRVVATDGGTPPLTGSVLVTMSVMPAHVVG